MKLQSPLAAARAEGGPGEILTEMLKVKPELKLNTKPSVILMVGVNGVGKTTTIGKLAAKFANEGEKVILCAGDTFRAAAPSSLPSGRSVPALP